MKGFIQEFKAFAMRGNVVDLAVAVIIGTAFGKIVTSMVDDLVMPLLGLILGNTELNRLSIDLGETRLQYGQFLQATVDFIIIALVIFLAIRLMNNFRRKEVGEPTTPAPSETQLLIEIRDLLRSRQ